MSRQTKGGEYMPHKPKDKEELSSIGRDEAWFAKVDREYENKSVMLDEAMQATQKLNNRIVNDAVSHTKRVDALCERMLANAITADSERSERVNAHNANLVENLNVGNDLMLNLLARTLTEDGEVSLTIARPGRAKAK